MLDLLEKGRWCSLARQRIKRLKKDKGGRWTPSKDQEAAGGRSGSTLFATTFMLTFFQSAACFKKNLFIALKKKRQKLLNSPLGSVLINLMAEIYFSQPCKSHF